MFKQNNTTGYNRFRWFSLPAETEHHIWLPPRLSASSCFLLRLLHMINGFLLRLSAWFCFLLRLLAGSRVMQTVSAGSQISRTEVSAGNKRYRGQSPRTVHHIWGLPRLSVISCFLQRLSAGRKNSGIVSAEAKHEVQSLQEAKISGIDYTLWILAYFYKKL